KIIRRAGLEPWPRLWHSMRASCETDLARQFPLAVVAKWLGNTQAVAMRHYVDVTDADFERAVGAEVAQNTAQQAHAGYRGDPQSSKAEFEKSQKLPIAASSRDTVQMLIMEAAGIEPASRNRSTKASTCVVDCLISLPHSPVDRVARQPA